MKKLRLKGSTILVILTLLTNSCLPNTGKAPNTFPSSSRSEPLIVLERTGCFGFCPAYRLTIYGNGQGVYEGFGPYVEVKGKQAIALEPDKINELLYNFGRSDFLTLDALYPSLVTDTPTFTTTLTLGDHHKTVVNFGCGPQALIDLQYQIDEAVHSEQWVGRYAYQHLPKPDCSQVIPQPTSPLK